MTGFFHQVSSAVKTGYHGVAQVAGGVSSVTGAIGRGLYSVARVYKGIVDTGASAVTGTVSAVGSCAEAAISTVAKSYALGLKGSLAVVAKTCLGVPDFRKAADAFRTHDEVLVPADDPTAPPMVRRDERDFSERLGEATGHVFAGVSKAGMTTIVSSAYTLGTIGNLANATADVSTCLGASQALATGINTFGHYAMVTAGATVKGLATATHAAAMPIIHNPGTAGRIALYGGAIGACLYVASDQAVKAANAQGIVAKVGHTALATLGLAGACAVPILMS
jgi:hypothetical protein